MRYIARKGRPVILSTGASTIAEVDEAVNVIRSEGNKEIVLLQCVTNYPSHFECANIRAMKRMGEIFGVPVGYSDHTPGMIVPLGAVALGACVIEKHFTDDKTRQGPDHPFSMDGKDFKEMVNGIRILEKALGDSHKDLYEDEKETVILQRRCLRAAKDIPAGSKITEDMIDVLRPSPTDSLAPKYLKSILGKKAGKNITKGSALKRDLVEF